jgi:hypothetical protein
MAHETPAPWPGGVRTDVQNLEETRRQVGICIRRGALGSVSPLRIRKSRMAGKACIAGRVPRGATTPKQTSQGIIASGEHFVGVAASVRESIPVWI